MKHLSHSLESALMPRLPNQSVLSRIFAGLAALSLTVILTGCSNDDDAELGETVDASEVDSAEYVPASADGPAQNVPEPNLPAVATENTEEGAEATLKYFWEAIDYARLTGETDPIALVSHESCEFCVGLMDGWRKVYEQDSWAGIHGEMLVASPEMNTGEEERNSSKVTISFELTEPAADFYDDGRLLEEESFDTASTANWWTELTYDGTAQRWQVVWIGLEKQKPGSSS